jgi:hypothetical protein
MTSLTLLHGLRKRRAHAGRPDSVGIASAKQMQIVEVRASAMPTLQTYDFSTSSGSVPLGLPLTSRVIFSTRASAWRSSSSQRRLSASPRS